ncbi:hypothetical protein [Bartonella sp. AA6HLJMS]|uniref:hypothetical protein n=1 Tax=Bartonella sp. AA6HLJMS TaxID=3243425 RepID=UPI0035D12FA6
MGVVRVEEWSYGVPRITREGKAIVEDAGGVYEWRRITFFTETIGVIEFIVRGYIHGGAIVIPFMGAVHEMGVIRVGLQVLRGVFLKQARELAKLLAT